MEPLPTQAFTLYESMTKTLFPMYASISCPTWNYDRHLQQEDWMQCAEYLSVITLQYPCQNWGPLHLILAAGWYGTCLVLSLLCCDQIQSPTNRVLCHALSRATLQCCYLSLLYPLSLLFFTKIHFQQTRNKIKCPDVKDNVFNCWSMLILCDMWKVQCWDLQ